MAGDYAPGPLERTIEGEGAVHCRMFDGRVQALRERMRKVSTRDLNVTIDEAINEVGKGMARRRK